MLFDRIQFSLIIKLVAALLIIENLVEVTNGLPFSNYCCQKYAAKSLLVSIAPFIGLKQRLFIISQCVSQKCSLAHLGALGSPT
jgi:hypothetical protein